MAQTVPVRGGRARKHVHLTEAGMSSLEHSAAMLLRMMHGTPLTESG